MKYSFFLSFLGSPPCRKINSFWYDTNARQGNFFKGISIGSLLDAICYIQIRGFEKNIGKVKEDKIDLIVALLWLNSRS